MVIEEGEEQKRFGNRARANTISAKFTRDGLVCVGSGVELQMGFK